MRIRRIGTALCVVLLMTSVPATAPAETYHWRDSAGVQHFTDNPDSIPAHDLNRVREIPSSRTDRHESLPPSAPVPPETRLKPPPTDRSAVQDEYDVLGAELQKLQERLPAKKKELGQLRRKWTVMKGRIPTPKEIAEFEKKQATGQVSANDNPYVNKSTTESTLGTPGRAREAYYKKLEEIKADEARIGEIRKKLDGLSLEAGRAKAPVER